MQIGKFDRRILIEYKSVTQDATFGTDVVTWLPLGGYQTGCPSLPVTFPANIQDTLPSRAESTRDGVQMSAKGTRVRMRYRTDIDAGMRVTIYGDTGNDKTYQIVSEAAEILGRKEAIEFMIERYSS